MVWMGGRDKALSAANPCWPLTGPVTTRCIRYTVLVIIPAATVALVSSSMRIKLPVTRLREYPSHDSGFVELSRTWPISLNDNDGADQSCRSELMSSRYFRSLTVACA